MSRPLRVFLCHASQDKPAVRELYNALNSEDWIDPWLDKAKILPGQDWEMVIEKAVDDSDVVIVCLSNQSITKEGFVQREIRYAYDMALEKPDETIFLIPLRLDDCNIPRKLRTLHWVDYFGFDKDGAYSSLLIALKLRYDQKIKLEKLESKSNVHTNQEKIGRYGKSDITPAAGVGKKPYTRILDPSSLTSKTTPYPQTSRQNSKTLLSSSNLRWLSIGGIFLFVVMICGGIGLNYLIQRLPINSTPEITTMPTFTSEPISFTSQPSKTLVPIPTLGVGSNVISEKDSMTLLYVPAGEFVMGSNDGEADERSVHRVYLDAFWIDKTKVTNVMYQKCIADGTCTPPSSISSFTRDNYYGNTDYSNYPVLYVNWNQVNIYCSWAGRRLPTEAEWEKAARGTNANIYPWGNDIPNNKLLNFNNAVGDTTEVGKYPSGASIYGLLDISGNLWEWTSSLYQPYPYNANDGREKLSSSGTRVLRGGSWGNKSKNVRSADRNNSVILYNSYDIGFRCALSAE